MSPAPRIGLVFELRTAVPDGLPDDAFDEYEPEETILLLEEAFGLLGCATRRIGGPGDLLGAASRGLPRGLDAVLNIAEGFGTRNREAWAPVLLEMLGIPALGSDALTLSASLDKCWAKILVGAAGVPTSPGCSAQPGDAGRIVLPGPFPLFVKPRWEGTAKGIASSSRVEDEADLWREVERIADDYRQPALIEPFLPGAEYTVMMVGNEPPVALPTLQRALDRETGIGLHALERERADAEHDLPGTLTPTLEKELEAHATAAYRALACLDFARVDFRLDALGAPQFLEINPLPTFARDGSFGVHAELLGKEPAALVADVMSRGLARLGVDLPDGCPRSEAP